VQTISTFDLLAGYTYTLSFDYSRQAFSAGNGRFETSLIASLGSFSQSFADVVGFYYGEDWNSGDADVDQAVTQLGQHISFTASGPAATRAWTSTTSPWAGLPPVVAPRCPSRNVGDDGRGPGHARPADAAGRRA
jgi:hypothetical protein